MDYHEMEKYIQNKYSVNLYEKLNWPICINM
jgi:hypothetical protein